MARSWHSSVEALIPNDILLLESVMLYFVLSKLIPWIDEDWICWKSGALYWAAILIMYIICVCTHVKVSGEWATSIIGSLFVPLLCLAINPMPIKCAGLVDDDKALAGISTILTLIPVFIFGILSLNIICAARKGKHVKHAGIRLG